MPTNDTNLGGSDRAFPLTTWGLVSRLDPAAADHQAGMETLCARYWKPAYRYIRAAWSKSNEDAKDLTQAFFAWILEKEPLRKFDRDQGSFRNYLKVLLKRFLSNADDAVHRLKRGGGVRIVPIEGEDGPALPAEADPEKAFDKAWLAELVNRAVERVRATCAAGERAAALRLYEEYELAASAERPTYEALAKSFKITVNQVETRLRGMRREIRQAILAEISDTSSSEGDLKEEWDALFGS